MAEQYRKEEIAPIEPLVFKDSSGNTITVSALGSQMVKPAIDFRKDTVKGSRTYIETIGFYSEQFDTLYDYLTKAKKHWEQTGE